MPELLILTVSTGCLLLAWQNTRVLAGTHRKAEVCRGCGYSLDGLSDVVRCPECGQENARIRHEVTHTQRDFSLYPARAGAFLILAGMLLLGSWVRFEIMKSAFQRAMLKWYEPPGIIVNYAPRSWPGMGVGSWLLVLAAVLAWIAGSHRPRLLARSAVCGVTLLIVAMIDGWAQHPLNLRNETQEVLVVASYLVIAGVFISAGLPVRLAEDREHYRQKREG